MNWLERAIMGKGWVKVDRIVDPILGISRRDVRRWSSEAGLAESNNGIARPEELTHEERLACLRRMNAKATGMLRRRSRFKRRCNDINQMILSQIDAGMAMEEKCHE